MQPVAQAGEQESTQAGRSRRFLALRFAHFATDLLLRGADCPYDPGRPLVTVQAAKGRMVLETVSQAAALCGLVAGMALGDARAQERDLQVVEADPARAARALGRLADWMDRYTPVVALDGPAGLMLDVTGCAHLFGGEAGLLRDMLRRLSVAGLSVQASLAPTPSAARALAQAGAARFIGDMIIEPRDLMRALAPLPVQILADAQGVGEKTVQALAGPGLVRLGQLYEQPRGPLARRFGKGLLLALDRMAGLAPDPVAARRPQPPLRAQLCFPDGIGNRSDIDAALDQLLVQICEGLEARGQGARALELACHRLDGTVQTIITGTGRAVRDVQHLARLFAVRLDQVKPGFGIEIMQLSATQTAPFSAEQAALHHAGSTGADGAGANGAGADALADRLAALPGVRRVFSCAPRESHWPGRAVEMVPVHAARPDRRAAAPAGPARPSRPARPGRIIPVPEAVTPEAAMQPDALFPVPRGFSWRGRRFQVVRAQGPERVCGEWWLKPGAAPLSRDYYRITTRCGQVFWMFCDCTGTWFLHGLFGQPV